MESLAEMLMAYQGESSSNDDNKTYEEWKCETTNRTKGDLNRQDGYDCPDCLNRGYFMRTIENNGTTYLTTVKCKCMKTRATLVRMRKSGLGDLVKKCKFSTYQTDEPWQQTIKQRALSFLEDSNARFFFIGGQSGAGKTHICTAMCAAYMRTGKHVQYLTWLTESKRLKGMVNEDEYSKELYRYIDCEILYIDDFLWTAHGNSPTVGDLNLAAELVNARYNDRRKITIISSNWMAAELLRFDETLTGRIVEASGDYEINIQKDIKRNYRMRKRRVL